MRYASLKKGNKAFLTDPVNLFLYKYIGNILINCFILAILV